MNFFIIFLPFIIQQISCSDQLTLHEAESSKPSILSTFLPIVSFLACIVSMATFVVFCFVHCCCCCCWKPEIDDKPNIPTIVIIISPGCIIIISSIIILIGTKDLKYKNYYELKKTDNSSRYAKININTKDIIHHAKKVEEILQNNCRRINLPNSQL